MKPNPLPENYRVDVRTVRVEGEEIYGQCRYDEEKLIINPRKGDVINTIIHEKLHANYPAMPHDKVYENASKIESKMTLPEMAMELLQIHERSVNPPLGKRDMVYTECSNIISRNVK